jgi:hypothetical protein
MRKTLTALVTAACLAAALAIPSPADAQGRAERQFFRALGVGAGVAAGALLFGAAAHAALGHPSYYPYAPVQGYYYVQGPVWNAPPPVGCPNGFWGYKVNAYGQPYGNPRWICPPQGYYAYSYGYR